MEFIRKTTSLSPLTNKEIPAEIYRDRDNIYLIKVDEEGEEHKELIERDYELYILSSDIIPEKQLKIEHVLTHVTSKCNQNCTYCYEQNAVLPELPASDFDKFFKSLRGKNIILMGREPTMREDLTDIIDLANRQNGAAIQTNGLKLADYEFCKRLKEAGLKKVHFQFLGFSDKIHEELVGKKVLKSKLQAVENCMKLSIPLHMNTTVAIGFNDLELTQIFKYIKERRENIYNWTIRHMAPFGRYASKDRLFISDLLKIVCKELWIDREEVMKEFFFLKAVYKYFKQGAVVPRPCSFTFHIAFNDDGSYYPVGRKLGGSNNPFLLPFKAIRAYGLTFLTHFLFLNKVPGFYRIPKVRNVLRICLRSWPNHAGIDMEQMRKCVTGYYRDGKLSLFCLTNVVENNTPDKKSETRISKSTDDGTGETI